MPSTIISLDLRNSENWVVDDTVNQEINSDFAQKPKPPRVGWTINTVTTPEGIKSASMFPEDPVLNDTPSFVGDYLDYKIHTFIVGDGGLTYGISKVIQTATDVKYTFDSISHDNGTVDPPIYNKVLEIDLDFGTPASTNNFISFVTVFQNNSLHLFDAATTFDPSVTIQGDVTVRGVFLHAAEGNIVQKFALTGITLTSVIHRGITSFGNYLIIWSENTMFWSDPLDFTEFTVGGGSLAGSQKISEAKGLIMTIVPYVNGLLIYCSQNIVSATYSGDATNPWIFNEVRNGTGIRIQNNTILVTADEKSASHYAFTSKGIVSVTAQETKFLSEKLNAFISTSNIETKEVGSSDVITSFLTSLRVPPSTTAWIKKSKVNFITVIDDYLFIGTGHRNSFTDIDATTVFHPQEEYKCFILELTTGRLSVIEGRVLAVGRALQVAGTTTISDETSKVNVPGTNISNSYTIAFAPIYDSNGTKTEDEFITTLDMGGQNFLDIDYQTQLPYLMRDAEVFIGDISIKPNRLTELLGVKLYGQPLLKDKLGVELESTRARVFAYSSINGSSTPVEFIYFPAQDRYLGFIVGDDVQVEVRGPNFYLTDVDLEIQDGGRAE